MDGWKISFLLGRPIFRCYVSFREGKPSNQSKVLNPQRWFPPIDFTYPKTPRFQGLQTGGNLTPHDIPRILRVQKKTHLYVEKKWHFESAKKVILDHRCVSSKKYPPKKLKQRVCPWNIGPNAPKGSVRPSPFATMKIRGKLVVSMTSTSTREK